ncbi:MAG: hypothetical protein V4510_05365 [bacterium]
MSRTHRGHEAIKVGEAASLGVAAPALLDEEPDTDGTQAVLVVHGMGQGIRLSTLELLTTALQCADVRHQEELGEKHAVPPVPVARTVRIGDTELQRAEFAIRSMDRHGNPALTNVHVYEAYWAPVTEGATNLRGVMAFLWRAGWTGFWRSARFHRWMFQHPVQYPKSVGWLIRAAVLFTLAILGSLVALNTVIGVQAAAMFVPGGNGWPSPAQLRDLNWTALAATFSILAFLAFALPAHWLRKGRWRPAAAAIGWIGLVMFYVTGLAVIAAAAASIASLARGPAGLGLFPQTTPLAHPGLWLWLLWIPLVVASYFIRRWIVDYIGDVAVYVSPQYLDAFDEKRGEIKKRTMAAAVALYAARTKNGARQYESVAIVGHSLGSVIAYDALNAMLARDEIDGHPHAVLARTSMFLTFGSPLDKTAFFFGSLGRGKHHLREGFAAATQPLIQDYATYRKVPWVNVHSRADIISNQLSFYDVMPPRNDLQSRNRVRNIRDPQALGPIMAHNEYWGNARVWDGLHVALRGDDVRAWADPLASK